MSNTALLNLPYIAAAQSQKHVTHNEALRSLDGISQLSVINSTTTAPPGSPTAGDRYRVATGATGAWAGWDGMIAMYADGAWFALVPKNGWWVYDVAADAFKVYHGAAWHDPSFAWAAITGTPTTLAGYGITDAVTTGTTQTITGDKTFSGAISFTGTQTFKDSGITFVDDADATKKLQFQLSSIGTGTTRTVTWPNVTGNVVIDSQGSPTLFSATSSQTVNFAVGAMASGQTKALNFGTAGLSGSTTNIAIGSAVAGALGTLTLNSPTIALGSTVSTFVFPDTVFQLADNSDATKKVVFELSGLTTGTTRTLTVPDASGTLALNTVFSSGANGLAPASGGGTANFLRADGTWAAPAGGSGGVYLQFHPFDNEPPLANYATLFLRNQSPVLAFDTTTAEGAVFSAIMPLAYTGGNLTVYVHWAADTATSGTIGWTVEFERIGTTQDMDADNFASAQTITAATVSGTAGIPSVTSVAVTAGAATASIAAGEKFRIRIKRDVANDTATGDAHLIGLAIKE